MRWGVLIGAWVAALLSVGAAHGQDRWETASFPETKTEAALIIDGEAALAVRCQADALDIMYQIPRTALDPVFKGQLDQVHLVLYADDASAGYLWAELPIEHDTEFAWLIFQHENAAEWAREIAGARNTVTAALSPDALADTLALYNETEFTARGSTAASDAILDGCAR